MARGKKKEESGVVIKIHDLETNTPILNENGALVAAQKLHASIIDGERTAISIAEKFKFFKEIEEQLKDVTDEQGKNKFVDLVREEITKNSDDGKKFTTSNGLKLSLTETGTKYDFTVCHDPQWNHLTKKLDELKDEIKAREAFLKSLKKDTLIGNVLIEETGELFENVTVYPCVKTSTSGFKTEFVKEEK